MKIKHIFITLFSILLLNTLNAQETTWEIDKSHSNITFEATHFKLATVKGSFDDFSGSIKSKDDDFSNSNINVVIKTSSINTNQEDRDKHLKSEDFFNATKNPEITFTSTSVEKVNDNDYVIKGQLTVNGTTKPVELKGVFKGSFVHPRFKKTIGVFNFSGSIPRLDYNVGKKFPDAALGEDVKLNVNLEMHKK